MSKPTYPPKPGAQVIYTKQESGNVLVHRLLLLSEWTKEQRQELRDRRVEMRTVCGRALMRGSWRWHWCDFRTINPMYGNPCRRGCWLKET